MSSRWYWAALLAAGGSVALAGFGAAYADEALVTSSAKWEPWVELGGYAANRPEARRGEAALWMPFAQTERSLFFGDFRGKLFDDEQREGNAAIGYRFMSASGWNPGIWVGFDRRRSELGTDFDQISFGGELLSADWDLRVNGYVPLNDSVLIASSTTGNAGTDPTVELIGSQLFLVSVDTGATTTSLHELAFWGVDAEVGFRVPLERIGLHREEALSAKDAPSSSARYHDLRLFAGGYYFDHDDFDGEVFGPKVRAEWRIENILDDWEGSRLTFEASYQYDDVREEQMEAGLRLRIPLGGSASRADLDSGGRLPLTRQEKRMAEGLKRDTDIVSVSQTQTQTTGGTGAVTQEAVEDALSGVALNSVVFVTNGDVVLAASAGDEYKLIVYDGAGVPQTLPIIVGQNRTLLGGGGALQVRGQTSGKLATYTAPGARPIISPILAPAVTMLNNAHISNLQLQVVGANPAVQSAVNGSALFLTHLSIGSPASPASIAISHNNTSVTARGITINNAINGIVLAGTDITLDLRDSAFSNIIVSGIQIFSGDADVTVADTAFSGTFAGGAFQFFGGTGTYTNSIGNIDSGIIGSRCVLVAGTFIGGIGFTDNTTLTSPDCSV